MATYKRFTTETEDVVLQRMLNEIADDIDKRQGSVAYDLTAPAALEIAQLYDSLDRVVDYTFLNEDMPSELLTQAASDFGVDRKPAVVASGVVTLTGAVGQFIPLGTQVRTDNGVYFTTQNDVTLTTTSANVRVICTQAGAIGNVPPSSINVVVGDLQAVVSVTNTLAFDSGVDEESDTALLQRVYDKVRKPATSGNVYHYEQMALSVSGVGAAHVYPIWDGPGTVKIVVLSDTNRAPSQSVVEAVEAHIAEQEIIGAECTVEPAQEVTLNVKLHITLNDAGVLNVVQTQIETALNDYLNTLAFKDPIIRYTQIASLILTTPNVIDYEGLLLNNGNFNVQLTQDQVAVLGEVTLIETPSEVPR